jgi:cytochrome c peroxidase
MPRPRCASAVIAWVLAMTASGALAQQQYDWHLPAGFPAPVVPANNPMSVAKVELGRYLFYDARLSANGTQSCGSCHRRERAFADGLAQAVGSTGEVHPRGSMSLANVAYEASLTWVNPKLRKLEDQALIPMYGDQPVELGLDRSDGWLMMFQRDALYADMFREAFPGSGNPVTRENLVKAIASFERSIVSARSPYDRYRYGGEADAISAEAKRGEQLFQSGQLGCSSCHRGFNFSGAVVTTRTPAPRIEFHNILLDLPPVLSNPARDARAFDRTVATLRFKAPTLRNITMTAPYMHDGSVETLEDAMAHGAGGKRLTLSDADRRDLLAFLESLTDKAMILDMRYENPWRNLIPSRAASW